MTGRSHSDAIDVAVVRSVEAFDAIREEWDALAIGHRWPLLEHDWIRTCVMAFHAGGDLRIVTLREHGALVAAAPLVARRTRGVERLELPGMHVLHEPSGFLYRDDTALGVLIEAVLALRQPLVLQRLDAVSPIEELLRRHIGRGWVVGRETGPTVSVPMAGEWSAYVTSLSGKMRWQQKRARTLAEALGALTIERVVAGPQDVGALFETFARLERLGWKGQRGSALLSKEGLARFFRAYADAAAARGTLCVWFLRVGSDLVAAQLTLETRGAVWVLKIAYDETHARVSPGFQLTFRAIEDAFSRGLERYEFLGAAEEWKQRWRGSLRRHRLVVAYPLGVRGLLALGVDVAAHAARAARSRAGLG
jgi:CelD/BcsL family acetyltransferase involved in cellulose biosynthesis